MLNPIQKGIRILNKEGLFQLVKKAFIFLSNNLFSYRTYNLYEKSLSEKNEKEFTPKVPGFTLRIIRTPSEVDKLSADGFDFGFYQNIYSIKALLNKGTILFCIFINKNWAHSSWIGIDNNAIVDPFFRRTPRHNSGCIGPCATNSAYYGLGLYPYALSQICKFLKKNDKHKAVISTAKKNLASNRGIIKAGFSVCSEGYHLQIGSRWFYREKQT